MAYISESFLRQKAADPILENAARQKSQRAAASIRGAKTIFLSHSHSDKELAKGLKNFLYSLGVDLYIDWLDAAMPSNPNKETANRIKSRIGSSDHIMVLATNNAVKSRWVPWEIGIADIKKTPSGISILPVVDYTGRFEGNEYLQLYQEISIADDGKLAVFDPGETRGPYIDVWLRRNF